MIARGTPGLNVEWKLMGTGPAIVNAFENRTIDLAYIGLPPAVIGIARGVRIKCVAGGHLEGTVISAMEGSKGFPELPDLRSILKQFSGLKIGVPGTGSIHDVIISESLKSASLKDEVQVVNYQWADQVLEALHKKEVSAAAGTPALAAAVMRYINGKVLYPPHMLWPGNPSYGILVHNDFLHNHKDVVEAFLVLHEDAESFLRDSTREAAKIIADYVRVADEDLILDTLKISPKYCSALTKEYISSTMKFVSVLKELGYIQREVVSGEIFEESLINKIHPSPDHYSDGISIC